MNHPSDNPARSASGWRFAECELDLRQRELRREGVAVPVEPRILDLLGFLLEHRDQALGKEQLLAAVWPGQVVSDAVFSQAIMKARRAVGDDGQRQSVIRTVHGYGYRFIAEAMPIVEETPGELARPVVAPASDPPATAAMPPRRATLAVVALLAISALLASSLLLVLRSPPTVQPVQRPIVALITGAQQSNLPDHLRVGLQALLARELSQYAGVEVISEQRVQGMLSNLGLDTEAADEEILATLAEMMGVDYLLRTDIEQQDEGYRVRAHLFARDGRRDLDTETGNIVAMVTGVSRQLARNLETEQPSTWPLSVLSEDDFVNEAYARGLHALLTGEHAAAATLFASALSEDPQMEWARYELANALQFQGDQEAAEPLYLEVLARASKQGDQSLAGAAASQLGVLLWYQGDYASAENRLLQALDFYEAAGRQHGAASALGNLGILADHRGDLDTASLLYSRAQSRFRDAGDQIGESATFTNLAILSQQRGRLSEARQWQERAVEMQRKLNLRAMLGLSLVNLASIERELGDMPRSLALLEEAQAMALERQDALAMALTALGRAELSLAMMLSEEALQQAETAAQRYAELGHPANEIRARAALAEAHLQLGETELALQQLAQADELDTDVSKPRERQLRQLLLGQALLASGDIDSTRQTVEPQLASDDPRVLGQAQSMLAELHWLANERELALTQWRKALETMQNADEPRARASIQIRLAEVLITLNQPDEADARLTLVEDWNPLDPHLRLQRARWHLAEGRSETADILLQELRSSSSWADRHVQSLFATYSADGSH